MSYQQLGGGKQKDMSNGTDVVKKPKCVSILYWYLIAYGIIVLVFGLIPYPFASCPWTKCAASVVICVGMLHCARMISKRNIVAVAQSALALFFVTWMQISFVASVGLVLLPLAFLAMPPNIRWLKANGRFSLATMIVAASLVIISCFLYFMPSITESDISNKNLFWYVSPGFSPLHALNESNQHEYYYWQHGCRIGKCIAQYNQNGECCFVRLDVFSGGLKTKEGYEDLFLKNMKNLCDQRFGGCISWSNSVTENGLSMLCGAIELTGTVNEMVIFPREDPNVYGTLLFYDPQLCGSCMTQGSMLQDDCDNFGNALLPEGVFRVKRTFANARPPRSTGYGKGVSDAYGPNKNMFYSPSEESATYGLGVSDRYGTNNTFYSDQSY